MQIDKQVKEYLEEKGTKNIAVKEVKIPTCCSVKIVVQATLPTESELSEISKDGAFSLKEIDGIKIYLHENAVKYWEEGSIVIGGFSSYKSLVFVHEELLKAGSSCC